MKKLSLLLLLSFAACLAAHDAPKSKPLFSATITCFSGKIDSRSSCSSTMGAGAVLSQALTCGTAGQVSETQWEFIGSENGADLWQISRKFPIDAAETRSEVKTIKFTGKRLIVFEDKFQVVVVSLPKEKK